MPHANPMRQIDPSLRLSSQVILACIKLTELAITDTIKQDFILPFSPRVGKLCLPPSSFNKTGHNCIPSAQQVELEGLRVQDQPQLQSEFKVSLCYIRLLLKTITTKHPKQNILGSQEYITYVSMRQYYRKRLGWTLRPNLCFSCAPPMWERLFITHSLERSVCPSVLQSRS